MTNEGFVAADEMRFVGGLYVRKMSLPAGHRSITHAHAVDHPSVIVVGSGDFWTGIASRPYVAGDILEVKAGVNHHFVAHADTIVVCVLKEDL